MRVNDTYLSGLGAYLPETAYDAEQAVADGVCDREDFIANDIISVPDAKDMPAPEMGLRAAKRALANSGVDPADVSLIIYCDVYYQGPEGWGPASYIQHYTGCDNALAFEIRHQCNGMFTSMHMAASHLASAPDHQAVLIVGSDNWNSPLVNRWRSLHGLVLADGSTSIVLTKQPGFARLRSVDMIAAPELEELHRSGEPMFPPGVVGQRQLDLRATSSHFLKNSPTAPRMKELLIGANKVLNARTVAESGVEMAKVTKIGHVNASPEIVHDRLLPMFGKTVEDSTYDLTRRTGHIGTGDQMLGLAQLFEADRLSSGDFYLAAGVAPGLTFGTAMFEIINRPPPAR